MCLSHRNDQDHIGDFIQGRQNRFAQKVRSSRSWGGAWAVLAAVALATPFQSTRALSVAVDGAADEVREAVLQTLPVRRLRSLETSNGAAFWIRRLRRDGAAALEPLGFYSAKLAVELDDEVVRIVVQPGEPITVGSITIDLGETALADKSFPLRLGDVLNHGAYERGKQALHSSLLAEGYLAAHLSRHQVIVNRGRREASIDLAWLPGPRYRYGQISLPSTPFREKFIKRYLPTDDDFISADSLRSLSQNLSASPYFASAVALPQLEAATEDRMPVSVELQMAKRSIYELGLSVGTDSGPGVQADIKRNWLNDRGHRGLAKIELATRRQLFATRYELPSQTQLSRTAQVDLNYVDEQTDASDRQTWRLGASQVRDWRDWRTTLGMSALTERFTVAEDRGKSSLLLPTLALSRTQADDPINPKRGWQARVGLTVSTSALGSDLSFARIEARGKSIHSLADKSRVLLRGRLGAMSIDNFDELPTSLRFYAGGDRSVRGFDLEQLGPRRDGEVIGGEYVADGSVELDYLFRPRWRLATFVDAGNAFSNSNTNFEYSVGVGLRWLSPIGPLRLDVAKPLSATEQSIRFHFSAGPDL